MRWHGRRITVLACGTPTDMRKGFDGLCALVTQGLHRDPLSGDVFLFLSRDRVRAKVLHWDGTGLCVYAKRLERGRFASIWCADGDAPITLTALRGPVVGRKNHYGSRSLRGTQVAALFYTLCETARLVGVDAHAYLIHAVDAALATPGAVTLPDVLLPKA